MRDAARDPLSEFRRTNTAGTEHLARCAVAAGVKTAVFVSSIKVNGDRTVGEHGYTEFDTLRRRCVWISKWEAEQYCIVWPGKRSGGHDRASGPGLWRRCEG